jgi:hypothetical protein
VETFTSKPTYEQVHMMVTDIVLSTILTVLSGKHAENTTPSALASNILVHVLGVCACACEHVVHMCTHASNHDRWSTSTPTPPDDHVFASRPQHKMKTKR